MYNGSFRAVKHKIATKRSPLPTTLTQSSAEGVGLPLKYSIVPDGRKTYKNTEHPALQLTVLIAQSFKGSML